MRILPVCLFCLIALCACGGRDGSPAAPVTGETQQSTGEKLISAAVASPAPADYSIYLDEGYSEFRFSENNPGDYNTDHEISGLDLFPLAARFNQESDYNGHTATTPGNNCIDGNRDGVLNGLDLFIITVNFQQRVDGYQPYRSPDGVQAPAAYGDPVALAEGNAGECGMQFSIQRDITFGTYTIRSFRETPTQMESADSDAREVSELTGTVSESGGGSPISGALVTLSQGEDFLALAETEAGQYSVVFDTTDWTELGVDAAFFAAGYEEAEQSGTLVRSGAAEINAELTPGGGGNARVFGTIYDRNDGQPVTDAIIVLVNSSLEPLYFGEYLGDGSPAYMVEVTGGNEDEVAGLGVGAAGYENWGVQLDLGAGEVRRVDVPLAPSSAVEPAVLGRITNCASGSPVEGIRLNLNTTMGDEVVSLTDESGDWSVMNMIPGEWSITVDFPGWEMYQDSFSYDGSAGTRVDFCLNPWDGDTRVVTAHETGIAVWDAANVDAPVLLGTWDSGDSGALDVQLYKPQPFGIEIPVAVAALPAGRLATLDISDPEHIQLMDERYMTGEIYDLEVLFMDLFGGGRTWFAVCATETGYEISDITVPHDIQNYITGMAGGSTAMCAFVIEDFFGEDQYAACVAYLEGYTGDIVGTTFFPSWEDLGRIENPGNVVDFAMPADATERPLMAVLTESPNTIQLYDVSDVEPELVGTVTEGIDSPRSIDIYAYGYEEQTETSWIGCIVCVSDGSSGAKLFQLERDEGVFDSQLLTDWSTPDDCRGSVMEWHVEDESPLFLCMSTAGETTLVTLDMSTIGTPQVEVDYRSSLTDAAFSEVRGADMIGSLHRPPFELPASRPSLYGRVTSCEDDAPVNGIEVEVLGDGYEDGFDVIPGGWYYFYGLPDGQTELWIGEIGWYIHDEQFTLTGPDPVRMDICLDPWLDACDIYTANGGSFHVYDASDPYAITESGSNDEVSGITELDIYVADAGEGERPYGLVSGGNNDLQVFDLSDPANPVSMDSISPQGVVFSTEVIELPNVLGGLDYIAVCGTSYGIEVFDVTVPTNLRDKEELAVVGGVEYIAISKTYDDFGDIWYGVMMYTDETEDYLRFTYFYPSFFDLGGAAGYGDVVDIALSADMGDIPLAGVLANDGCTAGPGLHVLDLGGDQVLGVIDEEFTNPSDFDIFAYEYDPDGPEQFMGVAFAVVESSSRYYVYDCESEMGVFGYTELATWTTADDPWSVEITWHPCLPGLIFLCGGASEGLELWAIDLSEVENPPATTIFLDSVTVPGDSFVYEASMRRDIGFFHGR